MAIPRVFFVTGKGGTGKSTVAAALAVALARRRPTTLADLDRRLSAAKMLGAAPADSTPVHVMDSLDVIALTTRAEVEAFIERIVPVRAISRRLLRSRTFGYVTAALPGLEAFLLLERLRMLAGDAALQDRYVVIDAPASGTAIELLSVPAGVKGIAPAGSLNRLADQVEAFLSDPARFGAIVTVSPEELAIKEAIETAEAIRERAKAPVIAAIMNCAPAALFEAHEIDAVGHLGAHGTLAKKRGTAEKNAAHGAHRLEKAGLKTITLPMIYTETIGMGELGRLARALETELLAR
ncbi:MAG TPA: ArsA-related P-loop ATPase [Candidatus Binataceae bacterium]|nr:ArsA-related P-loop ATPase [Candidatus Binataceae bacterium]